MREITRMILCKHLIGALEVAVNGWKNAPNYETKREYISAIGKIGAEIHSIADNSEILVKVPAHKVTKTRRI